MDKQIYAALEICDHEVRLIVGEFFESRFNVLKTCKVPVFGLAIGSITDENAIIQAIKKATETASRMIGTKIERVLLCIPSYKVRVIPLKVHKIIDSIDGVCTVLDLKDALNKAMKTRIPDEYALIQGVPIKYTVNGISTRRVPINEPCNDLYVDIDMICADRQFAFDIVGMVEKAGIEVMDICLDTFAVAKEGAFFEQGIGQNVLILKLERLSTELALIQQGKLVACDTYHFGINKMIGMISDKFGITADIAARLLIYNTRLGQDKYSDNPVYLWSNKGKTCTINEGQVNEAVKGDIKLWIDGIEGLCKPILQQSQTTVIITGEGGELTGLNEMLSKRLNTEVRNYCPETLGVRNSEFTACLGLFYAHKDQLAITGQNLNSIDLDEFMKSIDIKSKPQNPEESITQKLKGILFEAKK